MINSAIPLPVGNAVQLLFQPVAGTVATLILRKLADTFTGYNDPNATVVYSGSDTSAVDIITLANGTPYFYKEYDTPDGVTWSTSATASATPASAENDLSLDVLSLIRERLEAGLRVAVGAGTLSHDNGYIPVFSAPPLFENILWPIVSVHLRLDVPEARGIGEALVAPIFDPVANNWYEYDGWLSRVRLQIVGWSQNADERIVLRKTLKALIIGNLPVFDSVGMETIEFSQSDDEDMERYAVPVFMTTGEFSCLAPSAMQRSDGVITGVTVDGTES